MIEEMTPEEKQGEAESWKRWQEAWGNTASGAHAFGWAAGVAWERQRVHKAALERSRLTTREDDLGEAG